MFFYRRTIGFARPVRLYHLVMLRSDCVKLEYRALSTSLARLPPELTGQVWRRRIIAAETVRDDCRIPDAVHSASTNRDCISGLTDDADERPHDEELPVGMAAILLRSHGGAAPRLSGRDHPCCVRFHFCFAIDRAAAVFSLPDSASQALGCSGRCGPRTVSDGHSRNRPAAIISPRHHQRTATTGAAAALAARLRPGANLTTARIWRVPGCGFMVATTDSSCPTPASGSRC